MRWLFDRAARALRFVLVDRSSRRIPGCGARQVGKKDQSSLLAQRASSDIDAGELEHQLLNGFWGELRQSGIKVKELTAF